MRLVLNKVFSFNPDSYLGVSNWHNIFLHADLEWKLIYVGSAEDEKYDQLLESVLVGPVNVGNYRFVFQARSTLQFFRNKTCLKKIMFLYGMSVIIASMEVLLKAHNLEFKSPRYIL